MSTTTRPAHRHPWSGLDTGSPSATIGVLGVPFDNAVTFRQGAAQAPSRIRANTPYVAPITEEGVILRTISLCDYGDVERDLDWERYFAAVTQQAAQTLKHPFALFIGGDHSVGIPLLRAFSEQSTEPFGVLHLDAHTDLINEYEGHRWSHACTARRVLEYPNIQPEHYVFGGIRSWVEEELMFLVDHPEIMVHTARNIYQRGISATAADMIARLRGLNRIYLTLDIDCLDPAFAPGTGTPESGGLSTPELVELLRLLFADLPIVAMDIVEIAPPLDYSDITVTAAIKVLYEIFGWFQQRKPQDV